MRKNGASVVKTHTRGIGKHMKAVHKAGKALFGDNWKSHRPKAMGIAHGLRSGKIKRSGLSTHMKTTCV